LSSKKLFFSLKKLPTIEIRNRIDEIKKAEGNRKTPMQKIMKHKSVPFFINEFLTLKELFYDFLLF